MILGFVTLWVSGLGFRLSQGAQYPLVKEYAFNSRALILWFKVYDSWFRDLVGLGFRVVL